MKRTTHALTSAWPYATMLSCLYILFAFWDGKVQDWGWVILDALAAAWWFLIAHRSWEDWSNKC